MGAPTVPETAAANGERVRAALLLSLGDGNDPAAAVAAMAGQRPGERKYLSAAELAQIYGATAEEVAAVEGYAARHGLTVDQVHAAARLVVLKGAMASFAGAFICRPLDAAEGGGYAIDPPAELAAIVDGVFGLDDLPRFARTDRALFATPGASGAGGETTPDGAPAAGAPAPVYSRPDAVANRYRFPATATGKGQTIAILLLGGGFYDDDLDHFFGDRKPHLEVVGIAGAASDPAPRDAMLQYFSQLESGKAPTAGADLQSQIWWTLEATVDIELAGSFAPAADLVVYFAPNSELGKVAALAEIITGDSHDPQILSCSWGAREAELSPAFLAAADRFFQLAALRGISVCYSSGDKGANVKGGQPSADFPASSPHVLACGGTSLPPVEAAAPESAWNESRGSLVLATGGGYSRAFPLPAWQRGVPAVNGGRPTRGVPDVAAKADYAAGYEMWLGGRTVHGGGTSSAAPLWAGLLARLNEVLGLRVGWLTPLLYTSYLEIKYLNEITTGGNGVFEAAAGWNPCTGLGSPDGEALLQFLRGA